MKYLGSKRRIAKFIRPIILAGRTTETYVEPFVGGANLINHVSNPRLACDINPYLVALFRAVQQGWEPPSDVTEEEYREIRNNKGLYPAELVGFVGFLCSFGAKFFGGFARASAGTNYAAQGCNSLAKQKPLIQGIDFVCGDYRDLQIPPGSIIYCDPPYKGTTGYASPKFDHVVFWDWVRSKAAEGHKIYVSESNAPEDFIELWGTTTLAGLNNATDLREARGTPRRKTFDDKLFTYLAPKP